MRTSVRVAWRVAAAVAFACTAALAVTLTRGAPLHVSLISARNVKSAGRHGVAGLQRCAASGLDISIAGPGAPARGVVASPDHVYLATFPVEFTNISGAACTLSGYPQVSAYRAGGAQVGNAAVLDTSVSARRVVLAPGASAHAAVVDSVSSQRCRPVDAAGLRVVAPGESAARYVRHAIAACSAAGREAPVFLHVRALQPGAGVTAVPRRHHDTSDAGHQRKDNRAQSRTRSLGGRGQATRRRPGHPAV
jgi:Protein of unknown function (DUF4232)